MPSFKRPGTYAEEILLNPQSNTGADISVVGGFLGANNRGPLLPQFISTWSEYQKYFGAWNGTSQLPFALFQFFAQGGRGCYVTRVAAPDAVTATRTLLDRAGSPLSTLTVAAVNPGAWGNNIFVDIADYGTTRFTITVHYGASTDGFIVERWQDLSMDPLDSRYVQSIINAEIGGGSDYIKVTDLVSGSALVTARPAVQSGTVLATGADGTAVASSDYITALNVLDQISVPFVLNLPGIVDVPTQTAVLNYATNRTDVFVVLDTQPNRTSAQAITDTSGLPRTSYGATYWPWLVINDPSIGSPGVTRRVPPGGSVVGQIMATDARSGVWKAPAGLGTALAGVVGLELKLTNNDLDNLRTAAPPINAIRNIPGAGVCIFGANTLDPTTGTNYINIRRTLIYLRTELVRRSRFAVFEPNTELLWDRVGGELGRFLTLFWAKGGLRGETASSAFYVKVDSTNNTNNTIQNGQLNIEVGVSTIFPAEYVILRIGQTNGGASVTEAQ